MSNRTLLCVDVSYQVYRAAASHPRLTSGRHFTGGLYGFFVTVAKMIRETRATDIAFCLDSKPYKRSELYPAYKQWRKKNADDELLKMYKESSSLVMETLTKANLPVWAVPGFESDDLIAHANAKYRHRYKTIYAGTNDSDLYQLLTTDRFIIYRKSIADVMDARQFRKDFNMTPDQYILWLALQGTHNDIEGIAGIGPRTARTIITEPAILRKYRESHKELIERNISLIQLPHPDFPFAEDIPRVRDVDHRELIRTLSYYDIDFTNSIDRSFKQVSGN